MNWAVFYSEGARRDCEGLPGEAIAALGELEGLLCEHPYLGRPSAASSLERSVDFGKLGQGAVTYSLDPNRREIGFLSVVWLG